MDELKRNDPRPLYQQIKDLLRRRIERGQYKPEAPIPEERALSAELGASRMTVRRAMQELGAEGLVVRIRGKGTFVRGGFAPRERRGRPPVIGVASRFNRANVRNSLYCHRILAGIHHASQEAGLTIAFRQITEPYDAFAAALREDKALKGLILLEVWLPDLQRQLAQLPMPTVLVDSSQISDDEILFNEVNHTGRAAVREAVNCLIGLGHTDIGLLMQASDGWLHLERRRGYEEALAEHGLPPRPERVFRFQGSGEQAYSTVKRLLREGDLPTALMCASGDDIAMGVLSAVSNLGLRVPRDLSLIGYGDTLGFWVPPLSTIQVPWEEIGSGGIALLQRRFKQPATPLERDLLPCRFINRGSCDTPPARKPTGTLRA